MLGSKLITAIDLVDGGLQNSGGALPREHQGYRSPVYVYAR
jgi:hypothetical protein